MRRLSPPRTFGRMLARRGALGVVGAVALLGAGLGASRTPAAGDGVTGTPEPVLAQIIDLGAQAGLRLHQISVEGRTHSRGEDIVAAIGLQRGEPMLAFDPAAARERLESLPWVKDATVERRLPGTIHVRLVERTPIALWQLPGTGGAQRFIMVDPDGARIDGDMTRFANLPVIAGTGAPESASDLFTLLAAEPALARRVKAAVRVGNRRWNVWLDAIGDGGIDVRLPEENTAEAIARLATMDREQALLRRDLEMIDLRLPDRLVVRVSGQAASPAPERPAPPPDLPLRGPAEDA